MEFHQTMTIYSQIYLTPPHLFSHPNLKASVLRLIKTFSKNSGFRSIRPVMFWKTCKFSVIKLQNFANRSKYEKYLIYYWILILFCINIRLWVLSSNVGKISWVENNKTKTALIDPPLFETHSYGWERNLVTIGLKNNYYY